ncbi:MAG TPA: sugar ABC transporter permease [Ktedonobacteraceae bacterium]|jgi:alpha-glucoside transport system permease protein|nr:sugar ABC transporter permease [Ktedonobacteraceae bacterium]
MATVARERVAATAPPEKGGRGISWTALIWIAPAVLLIVAFFIYPLIQTLIYSFENADSTKFVGFKNYIFIGTDPDMIEALRNNLLWLVLGTLLTVGLGLIIAVLVDRVKIEAIIKSALFIPMAISFVGASVIWKFVYDYSPQIGLLNAFLGLFHVPQQAWLQNPAIDNFALIVIYTWMWTGFSMVIISAALKGIPDDVIEAAKMDGAGRFTMFWSIMMPMIGPTLGVVATTMIINILKIFDVIYVETGGNYGTDVVAMEFYTRAFTDLDYGKGSALAILLTVVIIPVMIINVRRMRREEQGR